MQSLRPIRDLPIDAPFISLWQEVTMLSDVSSLYVFETRDRKYVFLGDQHFNKNEGNCEQRKGIKCDDYNRHFTNSQYYGTACMSIGILLHEWFTYNNDHKINTDFYLEESFTKENQRAANKTQKNFDIARYEGDMTTLQETSWMQLTAAVMKPCFVRDKTGCPYHPYVHAHYADVRMLDEQTDKIKADPFLLHDLIESIGNNMNKIIHRKDILLQLRDEIAIVLSIIIHDYRIILEGIMTDKDFDAFLKKYEQMSNAFSQAFGKLYLKKFTNMKKLSVVREGVRMHRVAAELKRLSAAEPHIADLIESFIYNKAQQYAEEIEEQFGYQLDELQDLENLDNQSILEKELSLLNDMVNALIPMSSLSMDAYLLARMFLQTESQEIIVYAGAKHIEHYAEFFNFYLGIPSVINVPYERDNRCVEAPSLPRYLNANAYRKHAVNKQFKIRNARGSDIDLDTYPYNRTF